MNWKDLWKKIWTPSNRSKAIKAAVKELDKLADKEAKKGLADPITLALIFTVGMLLGNVFGHGVTTRSVVVNIDNSPNAHVEDIKVEVSGSGGVSVPISGGVK